MSILFIGGASGSGKSHVTSEISKNLKTPILGLDFIYNAVSKQLIDNDGILVKITERLAFEMVDLLLENNKTIIVEGGWIQPEKAKLLKEKHKEKFDAVFCGYPDVTAEERKKFLLETNPPHYLATDKKSLQKLNKQIEDSKSYKTRSQEYGFFFFNFSDVNIGQSELKKYIQNWYKDVQ